MAKEKLLIVDKFHAGQVRDDRSNITGALSNAEEVDIFTNADFIQAEQIVSTDAMPTGTETYSYTADSGDTVYGYGKETTGGKVRIVSVANGGADNPGTFSTLFTSADSTNLAYIISPVQWFETSESSSGYLYYITKTSANVVKLARYDINGASETSVGTLSGLDGSFDRITIKVIYGELFITHGNFIAKVDKDGVFTQKAYTLPLELEAIDLIPVSDVSLVLCRNKNKRINRTTCLWWDLTATLTFDDSFSLSVGGPQWIVIQKEIITIFCSNNGDGYFFQMPAAIGSVPIELPNMRIKNVSADTTNQPASTSKMVSEKDSILYFGLKKTDKTGIYALGKLDDDKNTALILSKRFDTTDYSLHSPTALYIQGPNYYASFDDNGTADNSRCESNNSPSRSSSATISTVWIDDATPFQEKSISRAFLTAYPLGASTSLALSLATDYGTTFTAIKRADDSVFNTANGVFGIFRPTAFNNKLAYQAKVSFTSNGTDSPKLQHIGLRVSIKDID